MASSAPGLQSQRIPYVDLVRQHGGLEEDLLEAVRRVLRHGQFILGPEVEAFEVQVASRVGVDHAVGVSNGTDALVLALRACGIGPGDEVITVSHSFVATGLAIRLVGARPVFVDIDDETLLMDPSQLEGSRSERTKAVMPVHLAGFPCEMDAIADFCHHHGLALIEDCAQALGARYKGRAVGSFGVGCFSLHPLKPLAACGDAGIITTADDELAMTLRQLRNLGLRDRDHCCRVSGNYRLDTLQAALLLAKLPHFDRWLEARRLRAERYRSALGDLVRMPAEEGRNFATYSAFVVRHRERDRLGAFLSEVGIATPVHYPLAIHQQEAFGDCAVGPLPVTERAVGEILSLPVSPELTLSEQDVVISLLREGLVQHR